MRMIKTLSNLLLITVLICHSAYAKKSPKPNILFITVDDMNWNSLGVYGCKVPNISPNIDKLAKGGLRFEKAYVQAPNCSPSRGVFQSGQYPHTSGMRGFFFVDKNDATLPEILRQNGYFTGVINKATDTSFSKDYSKYWNFNKKFTGKTKRLATAYKEGMREFLAAQAKADKPFYCVVNIADPHKLFFNDPGTKKEGVVDPAPSYIYKPKDVEVPAFLPKHPNIRKEMTNYYNSVKRADDCFAAVMAELKKSGKEENTLIVFISDHGMALPYAKSSVYENGVRTPWIMKWGNKIKPSVDKEHLVSAIDFMPTILDAVNIKQPKFMQGQSILPIVNGKKQADRDMVFVEFNENAGGTPRPIRGIHTKKFNYVFNSWATGKYEFKSAAQSHTSYKVMKKLSKTDADVKKRFDYLNFRAVEELYDLENDPDALHNLINDPKYADEVKAMRKAMEKWMKETNDYLLPAFLAKDNKAKLNELMEIEEEKGRQRAETLQWKRYKNIAGGTGKNKALFVVE